MCRVAGVAGIPVILLAAVACGGGSSQDGPDDDDGNPPVSALIVSQEIEPFPDVLHPGVGLEDQEGPAIGIGEGTALFVWSDRRADPFGSSGGDVYGVRLGADGTQLDSVPIPIATGHEEDVEPAIAYGDGVFFVVWWAITRSPNGSGGDGTLRGARVAADGTVLDPEGIALATDAAPPEVLFHGGKFYIAFESNAGSALRVMTVTPSGEVETEAVDIDPNGFGPKLASDGEHLLMSYLAEPSVENRSQRVVSLEEDLSATEIKRWSVSIGFEAPIAGGPSGFAILWEEESTFVRRLDAQGNWLDPAPIQAFGARDIVRDGDGYLLASYDGMRRLEDDDTVLGDAAPHFPDQSNYDMELAASGDLRMVVWSSLPISDVYAARLDAAGQLLDSAPILAPRASTAQLAPSVATIGGEPFVAFVEVSATTRSIRHGLASNGPALQEIAGAGAPRVASRGTDGLLVWASDGFKAAPITPGGVVGAPVTVTAASGSAQGLAATRDGYVVTYSTPTDDTDSYETVAAVLSPGGQIVSSTLLGQFEVAVPVAIGNDVLVALRSWDTVSGELTVRCLSNGQERIFSAFAPDDSPVFASDGTRALVVWTDDETRLIEGALLDATCSATTQFTISDPGIEAISPAVTFDGESFVVAWRALGPAGLDLRAARVGQDGTVLDTTSYVVSAEAGNELGPSLTPSGDGVLVVYPRYDLEAAGVRIFTRTVE